MTFANKRIHTRSQYFLIKGKDDLIPVYAFRDQEDVSAVPGLLMDLGEGGLQVLTTLTTRLLDHIYNLEIVVPPDLTALQSTAKVHKIWSREDGLNVRTGFAFEPNETAGVHWLEALKGSEHHLLRCVLHPV